jgi:ketosteroid isomerase-like protein
MQNRHSNQLCLGLLALICAIAFPSFALAQKQADVDAVNRLLERYRATEDASDLVSQGKLMTPDRVWVSQFAGGRRIDNVENMRIQQAQADRRKKVLPGMVQFTEDREPLLRFYGGGDVAVVSFFRYVTRVFPPETSEEVKREYAPSNEMMTVVLEKRGGEWKIVHTHVSRL